MDQRRQNPPHRHHHLGEVSLLRLEVAAKELLIIRARIPLPVSK